MAARGKKFLNCDCAAEVVSALDRKYQTAPAYPCMAECKLCIVGMVVQFDRNLADSGPVETLLACREPGLT